MFEFTVSSYGSIIQELLAERRVQELGPGEPNESVREKLHSLSTQQLFKPALIADDDMADCCLSALWLYHDFLDESHAISQGIHSASGSYWHGVMHRREPDASNASYWFRKVGGHPIFFALHESASQIIANEQAPTELQKLAANPKWDPFAFIHLCDQSRDRGNETERVCKMIQSLEWEILFDFCYQEAL